MKILFLCHRFPFPPRDGAKLRAMKMIEHLSRRHEVFVVSMIRDDEEARQAAGLMDFCAGYQAPRLHKAAQLLKVGSAPLRGMPLSFGYFESAAVQAAVDRWTREVAFDRIVAYCSSMAPYVAAVRNIPKFLDFCDMDSEKWRMYAQVTPMPKRLMFRYEHQAVARQERKFVEAFDLCTVATPAELETLSERGAGDRGAWFPNGVDLQYFSPLAEPYDPDLLCFVGRMDYLPNIRCVERISRHVLPLIRTRRPNARFVIVGAQPAKDVRCLREIPGVEVTGSVPDVRPWLGRAAAMVAPLDIARGTQNKVLESMAMGVPVITSTLVTKGIDAVVGTDLLTAESDQEIAEAALKLMESPADRQRISRSGYALVQRRYDWAESMSRFELLLLGLTLRPKGARTGQG